ncbi:Sacsin [Holothuria leucospilota]|uniref:Sacsin n=1 Tax=Holothuria leucospilota TaxID=206669 RepID=A0A9Q1BI37_HOLLE|nr:Sacsin [Holothuria leucospilota]
MLPSFLSQKGTNVEARSYRLMPKFASSGRDGPALCSYNNAVFKDKDWEGIQKLARSCKKNDALKVGRFGIGFSSVYHLTDLPCIISQNTLAMIDPFEQYFHYDGRRSSGYRWDFDRIFEEYEDQVHPFQSALPPGVKFLGKGLPQGTLFRFPLRKEPNSLSKSVFSPQKTRDLLEAFQEDARVVLLFLRKIEKVCVHLKEPHCKTHKLYLEILHDQSSIKELREKRENFCRFVQTFEKTGNASCNINMVNSFDLKTRWNDFKSGRSYEVKEKWVVSQELAAKCSHKLAVMYKDLKLLPWVGVAVPLFNGALFKGRTFCFLPLPAGEESLSPLPVHVHGFFAVGDDRRSLKWPNSDQIQNKEAEWNKLLVDEVLPQVYLKALLEAIHVTLQQNLDPNIVYKAIPDISQELGYWKEAVVTLLSSIFEHKVLYCRAQKAWMGITEVIIMTQDLPVSSKRSRVIVKCLQRSGLYVIEDLPRHVRDAIRKFAPETRYVSASLVIKCLLQQSVKEYSYEDRLHLLDYLLETGSNAKEMKGLQLLPTDTGEFITFTDYPTTNEIVYQGSSLCPQKLLPGFHHRFVKNLKDPFSNLQKKLGDMCTSEEWKQLRWLDTAAVTSLLPTALPQSWSQESDGQMAWSPSAKNQPDVEWLEMLWQFICREEVNLTKLEGLKLLPVSDIKKKPIQMMPLKRNSKVIKVKRSDKKFPNFTSMQVILKKLGITVCEIPNFVSKYHQILDLNFVYTFSPNGVLSILQITGKKLIEHVCVANTVTQEDVCSLLLPYISEATISLADKTFLRDLSILRPFHNMTSTSLSSLSSGMLVLQEEDFQKLPKIKFYKKYLLVCDDKLLFLMKKLDVVPQPFKAVLKDILRDAQLQRYCESDIKVLCEWIKAHFDMIVALSDVKDMLQEVAFVPNGNNKRKKPKDLYNTSDDVVKTLVLDKEVLASEKFLKDWLEILLKLGIKTQKDITPTHLVAAAWNISSSNVTQAAILVKYLCKYPHCLINNPNLCSQLKQISFVPCVEVPPGFYPKNLSFAGKQGLLYKPNDLVVYSKETCLLTGASAPLVSAFTSHDVCTYLGVRKGPDVKEVLQQLHCCVQLTGRKPQWEIVKHIYQFLNQKIEVFKGEILRGLPKKWILIRDQFMDVQSVYKEETQGTIDLRPFLCVLPTRYREYDDLLTVAGVPDETDKDSSFLLDVLEKV